MARTFTAGQLADIQSPHSTKALRLEIEDPDGNYVDVSTGLDTPDWLTSFSLQEDQDTFCMSMNAVLLRDTGIDSLLSLAPLREDSTLNVDGGAAYAPFLDVARKWRASVSVVSYGEAESYELIGEGLIDTVVVNDPEPTITLTGRCLGASLADAWIEIAQTYSAGGTDDLEDVIQDILDDNLTSPPTLYVPSSPGFAVYEYEQQKESVMSAINKLAGLAGMAVRYMYDSSDVFQLTLYEPDRSAVGTGDEVWEITPEEYTKLPQAEIDLDGVRNKIVINYFDDSTDTITTHTESDATSIARYGGPHSIPRVLEIDLSRDLRIHTSTQVNTLAEAILSDIKDPSFEQEFEVPGFWIVQLADFGKFLANGVHYDQDQYGGVTRILHDFRNGEYTVRIWTRGTPSAKYRGWTGGLPPEVTELPSGSGTVAIGEDGSVAVAISAAEDIGSIRYATSTSAFPTLATVRASGTTAAGRQITFSLAAATLDLGDSIYITAIPYQLPGALGYEAPSIQLKGTRHDHSATKTVYHTAARFVPYNDSDGLYTFTDAYLVPFSVGTVSFPGTVLSFTASATIPFGVTITSFSVELYSGNSVSTGETYAEFQRVSTTGGVTVLADVTHATGAGWATKTDTMSESASADRRYRVYLLLTVTDTGAETDTRCAAFSVTYSMPSTVNSL